MDTPSVLSLCAGVAGLDLGIKLALGSARTVCFVENEGTAIEKLVARMEDGALDDAPIWTSLKTFDGRPWRGRVDILVAGYPCQPFSVAGKQRGAKDPRHLWPHVARIIREAEPRLVFLENVSNHLRVGFRQVARELRAMGYEIEAGLFTAAEVGAPHLRKRLFVLAHAGFTDGSREELADARQRRAADVVNARLPFTERRRANANRIDGSTPPDSAGRAGGAVADSASARRNRSARREQLPVGSSLQTARPGDGHREVADAAIPRLPLGQDQTLPRLATAERTGAFPPGPADLAAWTALLHRDPSLEPAFCGNADGLTSRVDRLRATGNAVVPLVAAYAFRSLARAAGLEVEAATAALARAT